MDSNFSKQRHANELNYRKIKKFFEMTAVAHIPFLEKNMPRLSGLRADKMYLFSSIYNSTCYHITFHDAPKNVH